MFYEGIDLDTLPRYGECIIDGQRFINRVPISIVPKKPAESKIYGHNQDRKNQKWRRQDFPKNFEKWSKEEKEVFYDREWERRRNGFWFFNEGEATYITGAHYFYLNWCQIDIGYPDYRDRDRRFYYFWDQCSKDPNSYGMIFMKHRREGASWKSASLQLYYTTGEANAHGGMLSKTGDDAKKLFQKTVYIWRRLPEFFMPISDGTDNPKTAINFQRPSKRRTANNKDIDNGQALDSSISWMTTTENAFDGQKLRFFNSDECLAPETKVLMADGRFIPIKDVRVGDYVIVEGNKRVRVAKRFEGYDNMYRIKQPYGKDYIVNSNHRLLLNYLTHNGSSQVDFTPSHVLSLKHHKQRHLTRATTSGWSLSNTSLPIDPYILGFWLGDGVGTGFVINPTQDPESWDYVSNWMKRCKIEYRIGETQSPLAIRAYMKGDGAKWFKGVLSEMGFFNHKYEGYSKSTQDKFIPKCVFEASREDRLFVLAGLIDSDGFLSPKNTYSIAMSRKYMVEQIRDLCISLGLDVSLVVEKTTNLNTLAWKIQITGSSEIPCKIKRKISETRNNYRSRRGKVRVEYVGVGEYVGIQLDAYCDEDRRLILEDGTLTYNCGKWEVADAEKNWYIVKPAMSMGRRIYGKALFTSTVNEIESGGKAFKSLWEDSNFYDKDANGQTKAGLFRYFTPSYDGYEGFIDDYGRSVIDDPETPVMGIDGIEITKGSRSFLETRRNTLRNDTNKLAEEKRQHPFDEEEALRPPAKDCAFDAERIYQQIEWLDIYEDTYVERGNFVWRGGIRGGLVDFIPSKSGRWLVYPDGFPDNINAKDRNGFPANMGFLVSGCDPYDHRHVTDGRASDASCYVFKLAVPNDEDSNMFICEYLYRQPSPEMFYEDILMQSIFYGCQVLVETQKIGLINWFDQQGFGNYIMDRPDSTQTKWSKGRQKGKGIPSSTAIIDGITLATEHYVMTNCGIMEDGGHGNIFFRSLLEDWLKFDPTNTKDYDATMAAGYALLSSKRSVKVRKEVKATSVIRRFDNAGKISKVIRSDAW